MTRFPQSLLFSGLALDGASLVCRGDGFVLRSKSPRACSEFPAYTKPPSGGILILGIAVRIRLSVSDRQYRHNYKSPDDLKQAVSLACESLYNPVWTEYTTKHAASLKKLVEEEGVQVKMFPQDVIDAMGAAAGEVIEELRSDDDKLVKRIAESFVAYRDSVRG